MNYTISQIKDKTQALQKMIGMFDYWANKPDSYFTAHNFDNKQAILERSKESIRHNADYLAKMTQGYKVSIPAIQAAHNTLTQASDICANWKR